MFRPLLRIMLELFWSDWQHVGSFVTKYTWREDYSTKETEVYIHCFESRWGSRRAEIIFAARFVLKGRRERFIRTGKLFQTKIYPWLHNRHESEIPSFFKVRSGRFDFLKGLTGKTATVLNDDEDKN